MRGRAHKPWLVLGLVVLLLGVAGIALADDPTTTLTGCLKNGKLTNVAVGDQPAKPCKAKEVQVGWNAHGSPGVGSDCTAAPNLVPGADLRGCDLTGVDLTDANLTGANLTGAKSG